MAAGKTKSAKKAKGNPVATVGKQGASESGSGRFMSPLTDIDKYFENYFGRNWLQPFHMEWPNMPSLFEGKTPHVDVIDRKNEVVVKAALPGVDKKDIDVTVTRNSVTIKGTTSHEQKDEKDDYYHREISRGSYCRTMTLPAVVDENKAKAKFKDGILELTLPKSKEELEKTRRTVKVE